METLAIFYLSGIEENVLSLNPWYKEAMSVNKRNRCSFSDFVNIIFSLLQ